MRMEKQSIFKQCFFHPESAALEVLYILLTLYQDNYFGLPLELPFPLVQPGHLNLGAIPNWQHLALPADPYLCRSKPLVLTPCHDEGFPDPSQNKDVSEVGWSNHMPEKLCHNHYIGGSK